MKKLARLRLGGWRPCRAKHHDSRSEERSRRFGRSETFSFCRFESLRPQALSAVYTSYSRFLSYCLKYCLHHILEISQPLPPLNQALVVVVLRVASVWGVALVQCLQVLVPQSGACRVRGPSIVSSPMDCHPLRWVRRGWLVRGHSSRCAIVADICLLCGEAACTGSCMVGGWQGSLRFFRVMSHHILLHVLMGLSRYSFYSLGGWGRFTVAGG
ncbi:hypothetical protein BC826DRAFT_637941 [Russula brevipes]|nr:hypothetical protein BC826DRAFT_637941 [Russula brevipes]